MRRLQFSICDRQIWKPFLGKPPSSATTKSDKVTSPSHAVVTAKPTTVPTTTAVCVGFFFWCVLPQSFILQSFKPPVQPKPKPAANDKEIKVEEDEDDDEDEDEDDEDDEEDFADENIHNDEDFFTTTTTTTYRPIVVATTSYVFHLNKKQNYSNALQGPGFMHLEMY